MIIFLRHGDDEERHPEHTLDPRITKEGHRESIQRAKQLVKRHGVPDVIMVSPMRRCRDTVKTMQAAVRSMRRKAIRLGLMDKEQAHKVYPNPSVVIKRGLSRYFSAKERKVRPAKTVRPSTLKMRAPIDDWEKFVRRANNCIQRIEASNVAATAKLRRPYVTWCITHALVLKEVSKMYKVPLPEHIPFLHCFTVRFGGYDMSPTPTAAIAAAGAVPGKGATGGGGGARKRGRHARDQSDDGDRKRERKKKVRDSRRTKGKGTGGGGGGGGCGKGDARRR